MTQDSEGEEVGQEGESKAPSRYQQIIKLIFLRHWKPGISDFTFRREEIVEVCKENKMEPPKNLGDVIYSVRYRLPLPPEILATQPKDREWVILGAGDGLYRFRLSKLTYLAPTKGLTLRKIPDATPEIITKYALNDEQALLARVRYNRLIDVFLGVAASPLQSHLRTKVVNYGQIEIDELYVGVDSRGAHHVIPVQAKGGDDKLGVIQTIQDFAYCNSVERYRDCVVRPVSAQFIPGESQEDSPTIALFELAFDGDEVSIVNERHYKLVHRSMISSDDLKLYSRDA